jgi:hypothetical protein
MSLLENDGAVISDPIGGSRAGSPNPIQQTGTLENAGEWKPYEKFALRVLVFFGLFLSGPTSPKWYENLVNYHWSELHWHRLYAFTAEIGSPKIVTIASESGKWGLASYANITVLFLISVLGATIWTYFDRGRKEYRNLYYWIRVVIRYQVGFSIVAWGFRKLIPMQMVWPPTNLLNTALINIQEQKLYWQSVGIVPNYESFLGLAEVLAGGLLLFRKTTALGGALTMVVLGNVAIANHVYDGSVHIPSFTYAVLGGIILWYDFPYIWKLLVKEEDVTPIHYYPALDKNWQKYGRLAVKWTSLSIFVGLSLYLHASGDLKYRLPEAEALEGAPGYYHVSEFKLNNEIIPYSPLDTVRWQDAVFEKWATLTFKVNRPEKIDQSNGPAFDNVIGGVKPDLERGWESAGLAGPHFFYYKIDPENQMLYLQNKNAEYRDQKQVLYYEKVGEKRIILSGTNEFSDSIRVVLDRVDKQYPVITKRGGVTVSVP